MTEVLMADGTTKPISEVEVGDRVLATDPVSGASGPRGVIATLPHEDWLLDLELADGSLITTTEDHEYWNETDQAWEEAQELDAGDLLLTAGGNTIAVEGLNWWSVELAPAYDLDIAGIDTYYVVTSNGDHVLVHNCDVNRLGHRNVLDGRLPPDNRPPSSWTPDELVQVRDDLTTSLKNRKAEIGRDFPFEPSDYIHPKRIQDETDLLRAVEKALSGS